MSNELLEALKEAKQGNKTPFFKWHSCNSANERIAMIEDLLALQRQECAEKAETINVSSNPFEPYNIINKESILNAKLF